MTTLPKLRELVPLADTVGRTKDGYFIFRKGYYYHHGYTDDKFADDVIKILRASGYPYATIKDKGDKWAPFRGGQTTAQGSHLWVKVSLIP